MKKRQKLLLYPLFTLILTLFGLWLWLFGDLPAPETLRQQFVLPTVRLTDRHGRLLYDIVDQQTGRNLYRPLAQMPLLAQQATIATEDRNFYTNPGVDLEGIIRAFWINWQGGEVLAGGSTITQQLARNLLLPAEERTERTLVRKLRESWLAWRIARTFTKEEILEIYLNQIYYGGLSYGLEAAAQTYFGRPADQLTLAELALLVGLPQNPAGYNPLVDPTAAKERQVVVLGLLLKEGFITQSQHDQALDEPLRYASHPYPILAPHFVMMVQAELDTLLTREELYATGGLVVRTTLDLDWQKMGENIVQQQLQRLNDPPDGSFSKNVDSAALVAMHPQTGEVLTLIGSPDFFDDEIAGAINMALTPRQPGSTLKPLFYAAAMNPGRPAPLTAGSMLLDVPTTFTTRQGESYIPVNFSRTENGPVLAREALASSLNIPAVLVLEQLGVQEGLETLQQFGLTLFNTPDNYDLSLALGGGEVRLFDLTRAYATLANHGRTVTPRLILEITLLKDGSQLALPAPAAPTQLLDEKVAWLISDILSDNEARRLSFGPYSILNIGRTAAVKTGTTNDLRDNWTVGYTSEIVVGVWVGNPSLEPMVQATGISGAGPIWHYFMRSVLANTPDTGFPRPDGLVQLEICTLSGLLPSEHCPYLRPEWFVAGTEPTAIDTFYQPVEIDTRTGLLATETTPPNQRTTKLALNLPPAAHPWAREQQLLLLADLDPTAGFNQMGEAAAPLQLLSPAPNMTYQWSPQLPAESQRLPLEAVAAVPLTQVDFMVNGQLVGTDLTPPYQSWWVLEIGSFEVWVEGVTAGGEFYRSPAAVITVNPPDEEG